MAKNRFKSDNKEENNTPKSKKASVKKTKLKSPFKAKFSKVSDFFKNEKTQQIKLWKQGPPLINEHNMFAVSHRASIIKHLEFK